MGWLFVCAAPAAAAAAFTWRLATGDGRWRFAALYSAALCIVIAGLWTAAAYASLRYTCDEGCFGPGWHHSRDAWQWHALADLATAGLVGLGLAMLLIALRRYRAGLVGLGAGVLPFVAFAVIELS